MSKKLLVLMALGVSPLAYSEGSPWLQGHGTISLGLNLTTGSTDSFFIGDDSTSLNGDLEGTYLWLNASYGYDDIWAFDLRTGYARTDFTTNPVDQEDIADTSLGVSYQFINEFEADNGWPTISGRAGIVIGGDYDPNLIDAIGDAADGVDLSVLVGKSLDHGFAVSGDLTYSVRNNDVADGIKYIGNVFYSPPVDGLSLQGAIAGIRTNSDIDIGGDGFGVDQFPQTDRDANFLIGGITYELPVGIGVGLSYRALLSGTNIPDTDVTSIAVNYTF